MAEPTSSGGSTCPVEHVRDLRSELMLKLLFHERSGGDPAALLEKQAAILARTERSLERQAAASEGFDATLALWRLSTGRACARLRRGPARPPHRGARRVPADRLCPLAARDARRHAAAAPRGHRRTVSARDPRAAPREPARSRRLLARVGAGAPRRDGRLGRHRPGVPRRRAARHLRDAIAAPAEPASGSRSSRSTRWSPRRSSSRPSTCSTGRRFSTSSRTCRSSTDPTGAIRQGWFEGRAERVFERRSDLRFRPRSTTGD